MPQITWEEAYAIGHDGIDGQHKEWLAILNELHQQLMENDADSLKESRQQALDRILLYCEQHFVYEEGLMEEMGYPQLQEHRQIHQRFVRRISDLMTEGRDGQQVLNSQLMKIIRNWLFEHIAREDKKNQHFLQTHA